jgi:hypothetical protein
MLHRTTTMVSAETKKHLHVSSLRHLVLISIANSTPPTGALKACHAAGGHTQSWGHMQALVAGALLQLGRCTRVCNKPTQLGNCSMVTSLVSLRQCMCSLPGTYCADAAHRPAGNQVPDVPVVCIGSPVTGHIHFLFEPVAAACNTTAQALHCGAQWSNCTFN